MAVVFEFTNQVGSVLLEQKEGAAVISSLELPKLLCSAHVQDGTVIIRFSNLTYRFGRERIVPAQSTDADATAYLQTILYS